MNNTSMRDAFFDELYEIARKQRNIIVISADMGAPSLDKFRSDLNAQFVNVGIAEQNMINVATGLALEGKKVFVYAIMPFATLRCYEVTKVNLSLMNMPVTIVGVGAGFSYDDSGPTHHATEDIAVMRVLPNMTILNSSDSVMAARFAEMACQVPGPSYVRLDREVLPDIYTRDSNFSDGLTSLRTGRDVCIIATGNMVHTALEAAHKLEEHSVSASIIDLYRLKPVNEALLLQHIVESKRVVTLEEHLVNGGMGSIVTEVMADSGKALPIKRIAIPDRYYYAYGGRKNIQSLCGLDADSVTNTILACLYQDRGISEKTRVTSVESILRCPMTQELDIVLVNPGARAQVYGELASSLSGIEPPVWAGLIAAFIREHGYSVKIIDAEAENLSPEDTAEKIAEYNPLLAGIIVLGANPSASSTPKMTATGELLTALKRKAPHITTILGGIHPSALPERTLREEDADFVYRGEGFHTIPRLLEALKSGNNSGDYQIPGLCYLRNGEVITNPPAPLVNADELPFVAWDLLPMDRYRAHNWHCFDHIDQRQPYAAMYTSLGCPFNCSYCNIHALYNDKPGIRFRSPEKVVAEIDLLVRNYRIKNLKILDELFAIKEERVMRICDLIIQGGHDLNIWAYARVDTVNERMLKKMKQAGINWLCYGFESANQAVRGGVAKSVEQDTIKKAIRMTYDAGIYILANFIFGLPDDNLETMQETLDLAKEFNFEYVNFYAAMAYPGSRLHEDALQQGLKLPEKWHAYTQLGYETLPLPTKYLSGADVLRFRDRAFEEYYRNPEYLASITRKFGNEVVKHIEDMLTHKIRRKYA